MSIFLNGILLPKTVTSRVYQIPSTQDRPSSDVSATAWSAATAYVVGNVAIAGAIVYFSIQNGTNKPPVTEPTYWTALPAGADGDYAYGTPTAGESRRQINTDGTITDFALGIDYPINPATMDVVNATGVATPQGAWAGDPTVYVQGDMVADGGVAYIAKQATDTGTYHQPGVTAGWAAYWGITTWATDAASPPAHKTYTWPAALATCEALTWNGSSDWRLPNILMLQQLWPSYEEGSNYNNNPLVKIRLFPGIPATSNWWSSNRAASAPMTYGAYLDARYIQVARGNFTTLCNATPVRLTSKTRAPVVLNDPYSGVANWTTIIHAKAALHVHTDESNVTVGAGHVAAPPHDQIDAYHADGYKVLSLTDHNTQTPWPWDALSGVNVAYEDRDPATLGMVAIQGNERTDNTSMWHHVMMYSDYNTSDTAGNTILGSVTGGGFDRIAHPVWTGNVDWYRLIIYFYNLTYDAGFHGIEIINSLVLGDVLNPFVEEGRTGADIAVWDKILTYTMPYRPIWGYCVDDSHILGPNAGEMAEAAYTVILVDELTDVKVKAALVAGQFYGVSGGTPPTLTSVVNDSVNKAITITASGWTGIDWISEGNIVANGNVLHYGSLPTIKSYVRARVKNATGDLWLQPVAFNMLH